MRCISVLKMAVMMKVPNAVQIICKGVVQTPSAPSSPVPNVERNQVLTNANTIMWHKYIP